MNKIIKMTRATNAKAVRAYAANCLQRGCLPRKSFEYRHLGVDAQISPAFSSPVNDVGADRRASIALIDRFWDREQRLAQTFRFAYGLPYPVYLPGRVYTYRMLMTRIVETLKVQSILDVGCGSGMVLHEAERLGITTAGVDHSIGALTFALYLASEFGASNLTLSLSDALDSREAPLRMADLVTNLGSLEHLTFAEQVRFAQFMGRYSKGYVLLAVPNRDSSLFKYMASEELRVLDEFVYPDEKRQFDVDFLELCRALAWSMVRTSCIHLAPTTITVGLQEFQSLLDELRRRHLGNCSSYDQLIDGWMKLETEASDELLRSLGWFRYAIFQVS